MSEIISQEVIEDFLNGADPEQYIVGVEYDYSSNQIHKIIQDPIEGKIVKPDSFVPFLWVGDLTDLNFYEGSKAKQKMAMNRHGILITKLETHGNDRLENGMKYMVKCIKTYTHLIDFFKYGGLDPWGEHTKQYFTILSPVEQYLVQKKKRLFKGIEEYSDVYRFVFDIETTGLDPETCEIILIGVKDNRGLQETIPAFGEDGEKKCIERFFKYIKDLKPTIIAGYNSSAFDFPFILKRAKILGIDIAEHTSVYTQTGIKEKKGILKLANEVEDYTQHVIWGFNIIDIAHSVRRAQAINSEIKKWGLKYITTYLEKDKPNRVYVEGNKISNIYLDGESYYVNPKTGNYKKVGSPGTENLLQKYPGKFEIWSGQKIVEQYLDDDLYETMVVDDSFSQSTFLLSKLVPTTYERIATMGTATLWKLIMLAWSYENNLAIPEKDKKRPFTGGLSRLLNVGYAKNIVKFDYSSLYPSIQLVYDIFPKCDVMGVQKSMLKYFRNIRIKYKHLAGSLKDSDPVASEMYDRKQLPIKIFINAYFGSLSAPHVFPWGHMDSGEMITCVGRQSLRMMIMFFMNKGYTPLVMDSVEYDTPIYLKDHNDNIVILPISDLFDENSNMLSPDGLRDFSEKDYTVLTKNGWKNINYVYRHETTKDIHTLITKDRLVSVTSDHSVFQDGAEIKPSELIRTNSIDIIDIPIENNNDTISLNKAYLLGFFISHGYISTLTSFNRQVSIRNDFEYTLLFFPKIYELNKFNTINKIKNIIKDIFDVDCEIQSDNSIYIKNGKINTWFFEHCYTSKLSNIHKKIPTEILNGSNEIIQSFFDGFNVGNLTSYTDESKTLISGLSYILNRLNINYTIDVGDKHGNSIKILFNTNNKRKNNIIHKNINQGNKNSMVYDISTEDGTFVGGIGGILLKNTDGVNFEAPENVNERKYIGKGNNELVTKDKEYVGIEADTAEFNDIFMRNEMGLDIDYVAPACINVSRKNYIIKTVKKGKTKIKLTGNTIKSKKLQTYVVEFLDKGLEMLLNGDGLSFVELYYEYVELIFNKKIPLSKIANKARVKQTLSDYRKYITKTTKSGSLMSRQAHMELILQNNIPVGLGDTIYYVNNGTKKSSGDVQRVTNPTKKYKEEFLEKYGIEVPNNYIEVNCYMIDEKTINDEPDTLGDYNVPRYLTNFNKRVGPLLCVFKTDIRDEILVDDPKDRGFFTKFQCELINGVPLKESGQDKFDEVMTLADSEVIFWDKMGVDPYFMYVEDSLSKVDQHWVEFNREVLRTKTNSIKSNEDEIFNSNDADQILHVNHI